MGWGGESIGSAHVEAEFGVQQFTMALNKETGVSEAGRLQ